MHGSGCRAFWPSPLGPFGPSDVHGSILACMVIGGCDSCPIRRVRVILQKKGPSSVNNRILLYGRDNTDCTPFLAYNDSETTFLSDDQDGSRIHHNSILDNIYVLALA